MSGRDLWCEGNEKIALRLLKILSTEDLCDEKKTIKVKYALQVILNETEKFILLLLIFGVARKLEEFLIILLALCTLRSFIGGIHCRTVLGCFLFSLFSFAIVTILAETILLQEFVICVIFLIALVWVWLSAPIPSPGRPVYSSERRMLFKAKALTVIVVLCSAGRLLSGNVENVIAWSVVYQSLDAGCTTIKMKLQERIKKDEAVNGKSEYEIQYSIWNDVNYNVPFIVSFW